MTSYHEYFTHNNGACEHSYKATLATALIYSLVNGLYKIITASIKLILDVEQFGASSDLIVPSRDVATESVIFFFLLCILIKRVHGSHRNAIEYFSA